MWMQPTLPTEQPNTMIYTLYIHFMYIHVNLLIKIVEWIKWAECLNDHSHRENTGECVWSPTRLSLLQLHIAIDTDVDVDNGMWTIFTEDLEWKVSTYFVGISLARECVCVRVCVFGLPKCTIRRCIWRWANGSLLDLLETKFKVFCFFIPSCIFHSTSIHFLVSQITCDIGVVENLLPHSFEMCC